MIRFLGEKLEVRVCDCFIVDCNYIMWLEVIGVRVELLFED